jgi:hypothetical protein
MLEVERIALERIAQTEEFESQNLTIEQLE